MLFANQTSVLFTCALLSRTWLLFAIAASSRQTGGDILSLLYPEHRWFYLGLAIGALPLSRLLLPRLWAKVSEKIQLWGLLLILVADISLQVHAINLNHWRFELLNAITLWLSLLLGFILLKAALSKQPTLAK
ncbi:DUF2919 family protein [Agarivorans sp.]|uniref:DUF2919 family protein n=1 Tax=Agarivorans sp. TaxID=1872412 RepID=UPI003D061E64